MSQLNCKNIINIFFTHMNFILRIEALLVITAENHDTNIWDQTVFEMFFKWFISFSPKFKPIPPPYHPPHTISVHIFVIFRLRKFCRTTEMCEIKFHSRFWEDIFCRSRINEDMFVWASKNAKSVNFLKKIEKVKNVYFRRH